MARAALLAGLVAGGSACAWFGLPGFATAYNLAGLAAEAAPMAMVAIITALCLRPGEPDLSPEGTAALGGMAAVTAASVLGAPAGLAAGLAVGALAGALTGEAVQRLRWPNWLTTLAALAALRVLAFAPSGGAAVAASDPWIDAIGNGSSLRVPAPVWIAAAVVGVGWLIRRSMERLGSPVDRSHAAHAEGMRSGEASAAATRGRARAGAIIGSVSALAGIVIAARSGTAQPMAAMGLSLDALCVLALAGHLRSDRPAAWPNLILASALWALIMNVMAVAALPPMLRYLAHALTLMAAAPRSIGRRPA